jgi:hypothetical protein
LRHLPHFRGETERGVEEWKFGSLEGNDPGGVHTIIAMGFNPWLVGSGYLKRTTTEWLNNMYIWMITNS